MHEFREKAAIVTGGAVRLGRALAARLAGEGVRVCIHYGRSQEAARSALAEFDQLGVRATAVQADFESPVEAAKRVIEHAVGEFGTVDYLINNAAIFEPGLLQETDETNWDRHLEINLKAPAFLCREFVSRLQPGQQGHIVNIADWCACRPGVGHLAYTISKAGLVTLTKILAQELAPAVRVNAIAPGAILPAPGASEADFQRLGKAVPLQRTGSPEDIAEALLFLLRSEYITGEVLHVTGGVQLQTR